MALFTNQASLSYNGKTVLSNLATGELVDVLSVSKTAGAGGYLPGGTIPYVINLRNTGAAPLTDLVITDDLGAYTLGTQTLLPLDYLADSVRVFTDGVPQSAPAVTLTPSLVISGITVPADGVTTVLYTTVANEYASPETTGEIVNTASVTGGTPDPVTATATVPAAAEADLTLQKSVAPSVARQGEAISYSILIENHGAAQALGVTVEDLFQPVLQGLSASLDGTLWVEGVQYDYDEVSGQFRTLPGAVTVPAATFIQDPGTGAWTCVPGSVTLVVTGSV